LKLTNGKDYCLFFVCFFAFSYKTVAKVIIFCISNNNMIKIKLKFNLNLGKEVVDPNRFWKIPSVLLMRQKSE